MREREVDDRTEQTKHETSLGFTDRQIAPRVANLRRRFVALVDRVPGFHRFLAEIVRIEVIDRALIIAAQALFSVTPLLVVIAAFTPNSAATSLIEHVSDATGIAGDPATDISAASTIDQVRTQTGIVGVVIILISALSFARAMQRLFERVWQRPHLGGLPGARRGLTWLVSWALYLQLLAVLLDSIKGNELSIVRLVLQILASTCLWWWTSRTLLHGTVPWSLLWQGALLTAISLTVMTRFSRILMPPYVKTNVEQFGAIGVLFALSTWLLIYGAIVVVAAVLGRVIAEEPALRFPVLRHRSRNRP